MRVFVGNLSKDVTEEELSQAVAAFGEVVSVSIATDDAGQSKGNAIVEMSSKAEGAALIEGFNGQELKGQAVKVSEARATQDRTGAKGQQGYSRGVGGRQTSSKGAKGSANSKGGFTMGKTSGHKV